MGNVVGGVLPANASRAFLMSSALRMLLIAILAVGEKRQNKKKEREKDGGDKVKNKVAGEQSDNSETFSYCTGDTLEMEQETRTCEVVNDKMN